MKLNKKGKPYIEPDQPKKCYVVDKQGRFYHPISAPAGFCRCGVMLMLNTKNEPYIFPARVKADHARHHTVTWMKNNGIAPIDYDNFIIKEVE